MQMPTLGAARVQVATWSDLEDRSPAYALVAGVDLVLIRFDDQVSVMFGRCHHRGALLADGRVEVLPITRPQMKTTRCRLPSNICIGFWKGWESIRSI